MEGQRSQCQRNPSCPGSPRAIEGEIHSNDTLTVKTSHQIKQRHTDTSSHNGEIKIEFASVLVDKKAWNGA